MVFALNRRKLARALSLHKTKVSAVGILDFGGLDPQFKALIALAKAAREEYALLQFDPLLSMAVRVWKRTRTSSRTPVISSAMNPHHALPRGLAPLDSDDDEMVQEHTAHSVVASFSEAAENHSILDRLAIQHSRAGNDEEEDDLEGSHMFTSAAQVLQRMRPDAVAAADDVIPGSVDDNDDSVHAVLLASGGNLVAAIQSENFEEQEGETQVEGESGQVHEQEGDVDAEGRLHSSQKALFARQTQLHTSSTKSQPQAAPALPQST